MASEVAAGRAGSAPRRAHGAWAGAAWLLVCVALLGVFVVIVMPRVPRVPVARLGVETSAAVLPLLLVHLLKVVVGAAVVRRLPRNPVGWLLMAMGSGMFLYPILSIAAVGAVGEGATTTLDMLSGYAWLLTFVAAAWMLLLFPDGHLAAGRGRWLAVAVAAIHVTFAAALTFTAIDIAPPIDNMFRPRIVAGGATGHVLVAALLVAILIGFGSFLLRWRRRRGVEGLQLRWAAVGFTATISWVVASTLAGRRLGDNQLTHLLGGFASLPNTLALAVAMLRYRLYDLDRLLSRSATYALVTAVLAGLYVTLAVVPSAVFSLESDLLVAAATLVVAAAFLPVRRRVQGWIDRRFDRHHYDARRAVDRFGTRLRHDVDLRRLTADVCEVIDATVRPTSVSLWLRAEQEPDLTDDVRTRTA